MPAITRTPEVYALHDGVQTRSKDVRRLPGVPMWCFSAWEEPGTILSTARRMSREDIDRLAELLVAHEVSVPSDNAFQRRARLLQALWREDLGLPIGSHRGRPLGSRLAMPRAEQLLENYLTETIRACVRREVVDARPAEGKLFAPPRIFDDLLSSQPLCFNLFAELQANLDLATEIFRSLLPDRVDMVTAIRFEHSPGRGDLRFTGDRSAHDVFVEYDAIRGRRGFVGIEVKYHERLDDKPARLRPRYEELADRMRIFDASRRAALREKPLQQIWRDHLLAGSYVLAEIGFDEGLFVFLHPKDNVRCVAAVNNYAACLTDATTFAAWTLESLVDAAEVAGAGPWTNALRRRYLAFDRLAALGG